MISFYHIGCSILFSILMSGTITCAKEEPFQFDELSLIWTAAYDEGEQVYFSSYQKNDWSIPVQISDGDSFVFHATGTIANDGSILVVWIQVDKKGKFLYSSTSNKDDWSKPAKIVTGMNDNREVVIAVDSSGVPWIAWTGVDDKYSDVFWSRWTGSGWSNARKAHADDNVPDVHPSLKTSESGDIQLSWQTFSDGNPIAVFLQWDGNTFVESSLNARQKNMKTHKRRTESLPHLPKFIQEPYKANFVYKDNYGTGIIPVNHL